MKSNLGVMRNNRLLPLTLFSATENILNAQQRPAAQLHANVHVHAPVLLQVKIALPQASACCCSTSLTDAACRAGSPDLLGELANIKVPQFIRHILGG